MKSRNELIGFEQYRIAWVPEQTWASLRVDPVRENDVRAAKAQLLREAERWLTANAPSVMDKKRLPPSRSKHDYMSLSIYHWPNPDTADGLPYVTRDGQVNPEVADYDRPAMARMVQAVETLALSYTITGEEKYARKAKALLHTWFVSPDTRMNPNMLYAQYIPGDGGFDRPKRYPAVYVPGVDGEGIYVAFGGVIEGVRLVPLVNIIPLLETSSSWETSLSLALRDWFRQFLFWLLEHQHGKDEASCLNNHGSWYVAQIMAYAGFAGETEIVRDFALNRLPERIAMQIEPDGGMPEELVRAESFHYVIYGLTSFVNAAQLAETVGVDMWHWSGEDGRSIRRALEWLIPYVARPDSWPYPAKGAIDELLIGAVPLLDAAYRAYQDPVFLALKNRLYPYPEQHRFRFIF